MESQSEKSYIDTKDASPQPTVAFLGPVSSYTHQVYLLSEHNLPAWSIGLTDWDCAKAALQYFGVDQYAFKPATTITGGSSMGDRVDLTISRIDIFEVVQAGQVNMGVVPFENSTNGAVVFTLDLLADRQCLYQDTTICGEAYLDVKHYLLGYTASCSDYPETSGTSTPTSSIPSPLKPRSKPFSSVKHIKHIYTHPQAYGQCEIFLGAFLKGVERIDVSSTSRAAELVKEDATGSSAAIASSLAAQIHGLDVLAKGIEDREDNTTRFFILRKGVDKAPEDTGGPTKSLISFTVDHRSPGALADVLQCFRAYKLNLTSINSRPSKILPFQYIFFIEFQGSRLQDPDQRVRGALEDIEKHTQSWRWLGSWFDTYHGHRG
jgi:prephenate dehydratase